MHRRPMRRPLAAIATIAATVAAPAAAEAAETFYATTPSNQLVTFTSQAPGRILDREQLEGLAAGETIVGLDQRPATAQLYALSSTGRILLINPVGGEVKPLGAPLALTGTSFGFDVDPQTDTLRIVSDTDQNLRVDPDDGAVVATDTALAYKAGDVGAGTNPTVGAAAFTLGVFGQAAPTTTTLFDIDSTRDTLVKQEPQNDGTLVTVGALGVDAAEPVHFDVAGNQTAYAAFTAADRPGLRLWTVNTSSGSSGEAATNPRIGVPAITALTAVGTQANDTRGPAVAIGNYTTFRRIWLDRGLNFTLSCAEDCTSEVTLTLNRTVLGTQTVSLAGAGTKVARIELTSAGRTAAAQAGRIPATITFANEDLAGNTRTQVTNFISVP